MGQMEPVSDKIDSSLLNFQTGMIGPMSSNSALDQFAVSNQQMGLVESMSSFPMSHNLRVLNKQMGHKEPKVGNPGSQQLELNPKVGEMEAMLSTPGSQKLLLPSKRKVAVEYLQQPSIPNKRMAQMEPLYNSPGLPQLSSPNKKALQNQSASVTPGLQNLPAPSKRMVRNDSISSKSGSQRVQTPKNRTARMEPSPKVQTESSEAVRSKMRESLAAALALVSQHQDNSPNEQKSSPRQAKQNSQPDESTATPVDATGLPEIPMDAMPSKETGSADNPNDNQSTLSDTCTYESMGNSAQTLKRNVQDQCNDGLPDGVVSFSDNFFVKDELLQENGLFWASVIDMEASERKGAQIAEKPNLVCATVGGDGSQQPVTSPQNLAFKIEAELFKLFGGVNKKYKEKGRSLMFNLKDRSNPELRERVMSGEISPDRLCAMTAEELASKELSQWRMAKAEEFAQMKVLPDSNVDIRRLVKKTHKGEYYQVEVEQDDGVSVEVSVGTTAFTEIRPKGKEERAHPSSEADEVKDKENVEDGKSSSEKQDPSYSLTILTDGTDLMQGLIVDELKDEEFLTPIVSLDEFMESLNSEPPFVNLPVEAAQTKPVSDKEIRKNCDELVTSYLASTDPVDTNSDKADKMEVKYTELELNVKSSESPVKRKASPPGSTSMAEHVWEGTLLLNISALVTVIGFYRSGEKTSTNDWSSPLEIKGRVRLDAFEKFLQELPMSRSRAVMVAHFISKEGSSDNEHANLREAVDSYVLDERLGFAEPAPGVEIYFCPPHPKILEMLSKNLSKDLTEISLNSTDNGLIGVVVWRKPHLSSAISPNLSLHHKHSSKKQHLTSRRQEEKYTNFNVTLTSKAPMPFGQLSKNPGPSPDNDDDDDDIPPGFGPIAARDEDDLPEFNFSGNLNASVPQKSPGSRMTSSHSPQLSLPIDQMRQLIHKYGQTGTSATARNWQDKRNTGLGIQPWNNDDDDMPEWQPQASQQRPQPHPHPHAHPLGFHQPMHTHMALRQPLAQVGSPVGMPMRNMRQNGAPSWQQGAVRWEQPSAPQGLQPSGLGSQPNAGQYYVQHAPRGRGF